MQNYLKLVHMCVQIYVVRISMRFSFAYIFGTVFDIQCYIKDLQIHTSEQKIVI